MRFTSNQNFPGEMEVTVTTTLCRRSNFLRMVSSDRCPATLKVAWAAIQKHLNIKNLDASSSASAIPSQALASTARSSRAPRLGELDPDLQRAFITLLSTLDGAKAVSSQVVREVHFHNRHALQKVSYTNFHTSLNHSIIYFHPDPSDKQRMVPAQVRAIFGHKRRGIGGYIIDEIFFAVHQYRPFDSNPFAPFPDFRAAVFHSEPYPAVEVIQATQVHCHANQRPWEEGLVVMRPADRVGHLKSC